SGDSLELRAGASRSVFGGPAPGDSVRIDPKAGTEKSNIFSSSDHVSGLRDVPGSAFNSCSELLPSARSQKSPPSVSRSELNTTRCPSRVQIGKVSRPIKVNWRIEAAPVMSYIQIWAPVSSSVCSTKSFPSGEIRGWL